MSKEVFEARIKPLRLWETVHAVKDFGYCPYGAHAEILVKTFEPDVNYDKAREPRKLFRWLRFQGIAFTVLPRPPNHLRIHGSKWEINPFPLDPNPVPRRRWR